MGASADLGFQDSLLTDCANAITMCVNTLEIIRELDSVSPASGTGAVGKKCGTVGARLKCSFLEV